ncbi:hypothetical protein ACFLWS_04615 [Chloroflexota bacterium]
MKRKFSKILGMALPLVMTLALAVALVPASTPTVEAATQTLRFTTVSIPEIGAGGDWVMAPGIDVGPIAVSPDGTVLFAAANITADNDLTDLLKSTDGGHTWKQQTGFRTEADAQTPADNTTIVAIGVSPEYGSDATLFVATVEYVYQSVDGAKTFSAMDQPPGWNVGTERIQDMDISLDSNGRHSVIIGSWLSAVTGEVYVYSPATTGMSWQAQTVGAYQVLAVAFSPDFASDEGIFAVTVNAAATTVRSAFGYTKAGGGWLASVGVAEIRDTVQGTTDIVATRARIAFPDDFNVDSLSSNVAFVGIMAPILGTEAAGGDVYKVVFQPTLSSTIDLNVRALIGTQQTGTNIYSLDVSGDADAATILVGTDNWSTSVTNYYWLSYYSTNSGTTWSTPRESQPTGGNPVRQAGTTNLLSGSLAMPHVLLSPDFASNGVAYTATSGDGTSGFSRTKDGGKSWNQISLVDFGAGAAYTVAEMDNTNKTTWFFRFEDANTSSSLWMTPDSGSRYERMYSYANPSMPLDYDALDVKGADKEVFFLTHYAQGKFWRSTDSGATFPRTITAKAAMNYRNIVDENTIYTLHNGTIWYTENLGRPWVEPEESILAGAIERIDIEGDYIFLQETTGNVFVSTDGGKTYLSRLGSNMNVFTDRGSLVLDPNFSDNMYIYQCADDPGAGIYRIEFNPDDPESTEWQRIDNITNADITDAAVEYDWLGFNKGIMYLVDDSAANVTAGTHGGIWRSTNFDADINGIYPPRFELTQAGLSNGDKVDYNKAISLDEGRGFFCQNDGAGVAYTNYFILFVDSLQKAPAQDAPEDGEVNAGVSLNTQDLQMTVILTWNQVAGATSYQYQVSRDKDFSAIFGQGFSTGNEVRVRDHIAGQQYYWRVRVAGDATPNTATDFPFVGAPLVSPWSKTFSYTVGSSHEAAFKISGPAVGATGVALQPTFTWAPLGGAVGYEIMVSEDKDFAIIEWSHTADQTFFKPEETLRYNTTYYWRVRGILTESYLSGKTIIPAVGSPWSTGIITTMAKPVEVAPPVVITPPATPAPPEIKVIEVPMPAPAPAIPSGLLYAIVGIGAVLVIALIVLIVRTRRVT